MSEDASAPKWDEHIWPSERGRILRRRRAQGIENTPDTASQTIGLALSGGGIRSATYSLGLMRGLAQAKVLESFDYLSTVSGGGYAGAFFGSLFARWKLPPSGTSKDPNEKPTHATEPYDTLRKPICRPDGTKGSGWSLWWLRSSGRYLAPTGAGDYVYAAALALRNLLAIHYVLGLVLLIAAAGSIVVDSIVRLAPGASKIGPLAEAPGGGFLIVALVALILWLAPLGLAYFATEMPQPGSAQARKPKWWKSVTWRRMLFAALAGLGLASLMTPQIAKEILATKAADLIAKLLGPLDMEYRGSLTFAAIIGVVTLITAASLFYLGRAAQFVEDGRHLPAGPGAVGDKSAQGKMLSTRVVLTKRLATALKVLLVLLALAALLYLSHWLITHEWWSMFAVVGGGGGATLIAIVKKVAGSIPLPGASGSKPVSVTFGVLALVLGFVLLAVLAVGWTSLTWAAAASLSGAHVGQLDFPIAAPLELLTLLVPLALITGASFQFINLSSIQNLYSSRLVRAYLGASNPARSDGLDTRWIQISDTHPDDNLSLDRYYAQENAAPVHIINVTLNETVSPTDPLVQRDRHGRSLAVCPDHLCLDGVWSHRVDVDDSPSPAGVLRRVGNRIMAILSWRPWKTKTPNSTQPSAVASTKPAGPPAPEARSAVPGAMPTAPAPSPVAGRRDIPEVMALGAWIGISGAAFSTGIGRGTSIGKSLLLGIANVRLGHWWRSGDLEDREKRSKSDIFLRFIAKRFRTQAYLVAELLGRFSGRYAPYWYLSDGGHFENTGAYELLRRRVGVIVVSDNGADPTYAWGDLANLMRLARIDFGCEFVELNASNSTAHHRIFEAALEPDAEGRGTFKDGRFLRLFRVTYAASSPVEETLLVVVKPKLVSDLPVDVREYAQGSAPFPQETTADQFFSEEQWESYRKLGETLGVHLAAAIDPSGSGKPSEALRSLLQLRDIALRAPQVDQRDIEAPSQRPRLGVGVGRGTGFRLD